MTVMSTILPLYFKSVFSNGGGDASLSTAYWGYANSLSTLLLAILAPFLGSLADYRGYKKKFFILFLCLGVFFTSLFSIVPETDWLLLLSFYLISAIGFSGSLVFYDAFLVDVTTEERMDQVSSFGYALGYIGSTIPFILCMLIVILAQYGKIPLSVAQASKVSFVLTALWWAIFSIPILKNVRQIHGLNVEPHPIRKSLRRLGKTLSNIRKHKALFYFLFAYFFYIDGVDTIIKMATSYGADLGISTTNLLIILLATQFVAFPFAILFGWLAGKFPGKTMLYVGILIYTIICIYAYFLDSTLDFWILAMLVGTSQGGIQALSRSYYGKLVPKENANEFFGFYNIFGKFAAILGPFLVGIVTQLTRKANNGVFSIILLFIIGGVLLKKVPISVAKYSID
jgi:MFS transporter, UMF1 family